MRQAKTMDVPKVNEISVSSALCAGRLGRRRAGDGLAEDRGEMTIHWMFAEPVRKGSAESKQRARDDRGRPFTGSASLRVIFDNSMPRKDIVQMVNNEPFGIS